MIDNQELITLYNTIQGCSSIEEAKPIIEKVIEDKILQELQFCIDAVTEQEKEWGGTAVRVNGITEKILKKIRTRM